MSNLLLVTVLKVDEPAKTNQLLKHSLNRSTCANPNHGPKPPQLNLPRLNIEPRKVTIFQLTGMIKNIYRILRWNEEMAQHVISSTGVVSIINYFVF